MVLEITDEAIQSAQVSEADLRRELALLMYEKWVWGLTEAIRFCGMTRMAFSYLLLQRKIPIQYSIADLHEDLAGNNNTIHAGS